MIKRLFSKENQATQSSTASSEISNLQNTEQQTVEYQATLDNLTKTIANLEKSSDSIESKLDGLDEQIKSFVKAKKTKLAKNKIREAQGYKAQLEKFEKQKNVLFGMKIQLETFQMRQQNIGCMNDVNQLLKESNQMNEQLENEISQYQDFLLQEQQHDQMWKELENIENKDMDLDSELERIEQEINMQNNLGQMNKSAKVQKEPLVISQQQQEQSQMKRSMEKLLI